MGKRHVRVIVVRKAATATLLVLVSMAMAALYVFLSGRAYARDSHPIREMLFGILSSSAPLRRDAVLAGLMPVIANVLLFVPWGFLMFVLLDRTERKRSSTYMLTVTAGLLFAVAFAVWQYFLPTPVTRPADVVSNAAGTLLGAMAGHLRKRVHVQFDH